MKKVSFVISLVFLFVSAYSQSCLPEGIHFATQEQIDSFPTNHPLCTEIEGWVAISGMDINNIDSLNQISTINGSLSIVLDGNPQLIILTGLEYLDSIGGSLRLWSNDSLRSIQGLNNLVYIGEDLWIGPNVYGLPNYSLIDISGLSKLNHIEGSLYIDRNFALRNIDGLSNLAFVGNLVQIGGYMYGGPWPFDGNPSLENIEGLSNLSFVGDKISIDINESLSKCHVLSICEFLNSGTIEVDISENAPGCNSPEEVLDSCEANSVNIDEQFIKDNLRFYPNPASQELNISVEDFHIEKVAIYTLTGQQVFVIRPKNESIDISFLQPGMYIVEVMIENRKIRQKLLVK